MSGRATDLPDAADVLFDLPADEFVAARNEVAAQLKADGDAQLAATVNALRRPTLAAWAINQAVRSEPDAWQALLEAGRAAQQAQRRALSGVRDSGMRSATTERRECVEAMTRLATAALERVGAAATSHAVAISATFEAASCDPDAADRVGTGRLSAPMAPSTDFTGLTGLLGLSVAASSDRGDARGDGPDDERDGSRDAAAGRRRAAMRAVEDAQRLADAAQRTLHAAEETARTLAERAASAQRRADDARATADRSQATATAAANRAREAVEERDDAEQAARATLQAAQEARAALSDLA